MGIDEYARPKYPRAGYLRTESPTYQGKKGIREQLRRKGEIPRKPAIESSFTPIASRLKKADRPLVLDPKKAKEARDSALDKIIKKRGPSPAKVAFFRTCANPACVAKFKMLRSNQQFCSVPCRRAIQNTRRPSRKTQMRTRPCLQCGKYFLPESHQERLCSETCRVLRKADKNKVFEKERTGRRGRKIVEKTCRECGEKFTPGHSSIQVCSDECRALRKKRKDRESVLRSRARV